MKKMMILAVVMMASVMMAGTVNWTTSAIKGIGESGADSASNVTSAYTSYLFVVAAGDGASAQAAALAQIEGTITGYDATRATYSVGKIAYNGITVAEVQASQYYDVFMIIVGEDNGTTYYKTSLLANQQATGTAVLAAGFTTTLGTQWTAVPEPTSMALLAIGGAVFGLRRKFRK